MSQVKVYRSRGGATRYCKKLRAMWPEKVFDVHRYEFGWTVWLINMEGGCVPCAGL